MSEQYEYWDSTGLNRQLLIWTLATRRQLERWEPLVAEWVRSRIPNSTYDFPKALIWEAATEHHFCLIAARHVINAIDLDGSRIGVERDLRAELIEGRDLHEHWKENYPVFNVTPRDKQPGFKSGKSFAFRYPDRGPYWWLGWKSSSGAMLLPGVSANDVHELLDRVESEVLKRDAELIPFVPDRSPSPWTDGDGTWWPKPDQ